MRLASLVVLLALTSSASAGPPGLTAPVAAPEPEPAPLPVDYTASYRGQTLGLDAAAVGLVVLAAVNPGAQSRSSNPTSMLELALATYAIGAPMVHLLHNRGSRAAASLALRLGAPLVLGFAAAGIATNAGTSSTDGSAAAALLGGMLGVIAASVIDAAVLAKGDPLPASTHLTVTAPRDGGMTFGLAGSF